jgi:arabinogalactan endo-1,4-beta-galactosidase
MEDCGAIFKEKGTPKDVYSIFADRGTNLVRVRLWVDPSWWQDSISQPEGVKAHYNDLEDVKETIQRAREAGMKVMLGLHYSDFWADPGRQLIPRAWLDVAYSLEDLKDSVYNYTYRILMELDREGLMPEFVKIGNENNGGILLHIPEDNGFEPIASVSDSWARHAQLYNSAIAAVRAVGAAASVNPKIVIHFSNKLSGQVWNYNNLISKGVTDFDVIGISYYYAWHGGSISELENTIEDLLRIFPDYQVMVAEMGYLWTTDNFDAMGNIINVPDPDYLPVIPEKQLEYLVDYTRAVWRAGGIGVIFWEPAWVTTPCSTPWGTGSSHDHVVFFDPVHANFMENGGGNWCNPEYYRDLDDKKIIFKLEADGADSLGGMYVSGSWTGDPMKIVPMADEGNGVYSCFTYLPSGSQGSLFFLNDSSWNAAEIVPLVCKDPEHGGRTFQIGQFDQTFTYTWGTCNPAEPPSEVNVTFQVQMEKNSDISSGVYVVGEINDWEITRMNSIGEQIFEKTIVLPPGDDSLAYYFLTTSTWDNYEDFRETVPEECALKWGVDRVIIVPPYDTLVGHQWSSCLPIQQSTGGITLTQTGSREYLIYPNPASGNCFIRLPAHSGNPVIRLFGLSGNEVELSMSYSSASEITLDLNHLSHGMYLVKIQQDEELVVKKLMILRT